MWVTEVFDSVQGEGRDSGRLTRFLRLSGCNLNCSWCDTPASRHRATGEVLSTDEVVRQLLNAPRLCITGGEPLLQEQALLELHAALPYYYSSPLSVVVETNGSLPLATLKYTTGWRLAMDAKPPSSGHCGSTLTENFTLLGTNDDLKVVLVTEEDVAFAVEVYCRWIHRRTDAPRLYLCVTPELPREYLLRVLHTMPDAYCYVQLHKVLKLP